MGSCLVFSLLGFCKSLFSFFCRSGKLLSFPFESPGARRKLYLVRRKDAFLSETEEAFLQFAQNFYRNEKPTPPMEKLPKPLL